MSIDPITVPDRESLSAMDEALSAMMVRLREIVAVPALTQDGLIEITSIYNNTAYIFLYLEANDEFVDFERLLPWRDAFHKDPALDRRILELLLELHCPDPDADESRIAYIDQLREKLEEPERAAEEEFDELLSEAKAVLGEVRQEQSRLLERLGVAPEGANPSAVFYQLSSQVGSPLTRGKLARAWRTQRYARQDTMVGLIDRMVAARRRRSAAAGHTSVLARTLDKCDVEEAEVAAFLDRYLQQALDGHTTLESAVREMVGTAGRPMDHFAYCLRRVSGGAKPPLFDLDDCLEYIFIVAQRVFGLTVERLSPKSPHVFTVCVRSDGEEVGQINFDLWDTGSKNSSKNIGANHTIGIRNRTEWSGLVQRPVAYVSCRFQRGNDGADRITFQNMHSLFHEFGHALNHLLIRKRISNRSGLEYLPLERLEYLSMWFEKWAYHPDLAHHLSLPTDVEEGLALCRRVKMIEYRRTSLERAVTAMLDFDIHRRAEGGLEESFRRLDERFGIGRHCALGDFPVYFTWPMFMANPGANFSYLFGAADSSQKFAPFRRLSLDEVALRPDLRALFVPCFDFEALTPIPDSGAAFAFYDEADLRVPAAKSDGAGEQKRA